MKRLSARFNRRPSKAKSGAVQAIGEEEKAKKEKDEDEDDVEAAAEEARVSELLRAWTSAKGVNKEERMLREKLSDQFVAFTVGEHSKSERLDEKEVIRNKLKEYPQWMHITDRLFELGFDTMDKLKKATDADLSAAGLWSFMDRWKLLGAIKEWSVRGKLDLSMEDVATLPDGPLKIHGDLDVGTSRLKKLPDDYEVVGHFRVSFSNHLTALPSGWIVRNDFAAERCIRLTTIGENLEVGGALTLVRCEALENLPADINVMGDINLSHCKSIRYLPDNLHVRGNLNLKRCEKLKALPTGLRVNGKLTLRYTRIRSIPEDAQLNGSLDVADCDGFELRDGSVIGGSLLLDEWTFTKLPNGLHIKENLDLEILSMPSIPGIRVDGVLRLGSSLETIEAPLHVGKALFLVSCSAKLPAGTFVEGKIEMQNCHAREAVSGIRVGDSFSINNCLRLKELSDLEVGGNLQVVSCNALTSIGSDVRVRHDVRFQNCRKLAKLPDNWHVGALELLSTTNLAKLPCNLHVDDQLHISNANIKLFPDDIIVNGGISIDRCPLLELPGHIVVIHGNLRVESEFFEGLPDRLSVNGSLDLSGCKNLVNLSGHLKVGKDILVSNCPKLETLLPDNFHALGTVNASNCPKLEKIGKNVEIERDFILQRCAALKSIDYIYVGNTLNASGCGSLTKLGNNVRVGMDLNLSDCPALKDLPETVRTAGTFSLRCCTSLVTLPPGLDIGWDLILTDTKIAELPKKGRIRGDLVAENLGELKVVPKDLVIDGHLALRGCRALHSILMPWNNIYSLDITGTAIKELPDKLHIKGDAYFGNTQIEKLPDDLRVEGELGLTGCANLKALPEGLSVGKSILANQCRALVSLPSSMQVQGDLFLGDAVSLEKLPDQLEVAGVLECSGCSLLWSAGTSVHVGGNAFFSMCVSLGSLPEDLDVGGDLDLFGCARLSVIPGEVFVGASFLLTECISVSTLPQQILDWPLMANGQKHAIDLTGSGIFDDELANLRARVGPGVVLHVSRPNASPVMNFNKLDQAVKYWVEKAYPNDEGENIEDLERDLNLEQYVPISMLRGVLLFLSKLTGAKEFQSEDMRTSLAKRVVEVLELIVLEEDARDEILTRMADSIDACNDKPIGALNQMGVIARTVKARGDRAALRKLAVGIARLQVVQKHADMKIRSFKRPVDEVVIHLRFEVALAQDLDLPVSALDMLFTNFVLVTDAELQAAKDEALAVTGEGEEFESWLKTWTEWQRQLRLETVREIKFSRLKRNSQRFSLSWTNLIGDPMDDPVRIGKNVWSLNDLLKHWLKTGMDLNNQVRTIEDMKTITRCKSLPRVKGNHLKLDKAAIEASKIVEEDEP